MQIPAPTTAHQGPVANQRSKQSGSEESAVGSAQPVRRQHAATRRQSSARPNGNSLYYSHYSNSSRDQTVIKMKSK